jgi:ApbE superfamily uncharacterized protein (UPF0280 family)
MAKASGYQKRFYRELREHKGLIYFTVMCKETDLLIAAERHLGKEAEEAVLKYRNQIEEYIETTPLFKDSLIPLSSDPFAPKIVKEMLTAAEKAGVGPMASVAGAIAEYVGRDLLAYSGEIIVENGGDLFLKVLRDIVVEIISGDSPLSGKLALKIKSENTPLGICTSSGTVGHSLSFGSADAVTIVSASASLADAVATSTGNMIKKKEDISRGLQYAQSIEGVRGAVIMKEHNLGVWGDVEIEAVNSHYRAV